MVNICPYWGSHHWDIDSKNKGECKCGATRDFQVLLNKKPHIIDTIADEIKCRDIRNERIYGRKREV